MKIGIVRETKNPPDRRVPLPPVLCKRISDEFEGIQVFVQPDGYRAFTDDEYRQAGVSLKEDLSDCDVLMGVKEVKIEKLIPGKSYMFFSHTAKKQPYNRDLLRAVIDKNIRLIDYEYLTNDKNDRVVAFGRWAGVVGAYNALLTYGKRFQKFDLKPAWQCRDKKELFDNLKNVRIGQAKILITGGGRVAQGAMETLSVLGINKVSPEDFLKESVRGAVYTQLNPWDYVKRLDGQNFELLHFFNFPEEYETTFYPYTQAGDIYIACHFWDPRSPVFMTREDMQKKDFRIKVIADVSCDVNGPIPSTIRASTIANPVYGYDPTTGQEGESFNPGNISVMAVDNLPGELPRDASMDFGKNLINEVLPFLSGSKDGDIISRATISENGRLTERFSYLEDFLNGKE